MRFGGWRDASVYSKSVGIDGLIRSVMGVRATKIDGSVFCYIILPLVIVASSSIPICPIVIPASVTIFSICLQSTSFPSTSNCLLYAYSSLYHAGRQYRRRMLLKNTYILTNYTWGWVKYEDLVVRRADLRYRRRSSAQLGSLLSLPFPLSELLAPTLR